MSEMNNMSKLPIPNWVRDRDRSLDENFCPECPHTFYSHIAYPHAGGCHRCPCTRTYESLVGEQVAGLMVEKAVGAIPGITKPTGIEDGNTKPTAVDEPELQLLILDMGDVCIVRVEQGDGKFPHKTLGIGTAWALNNTYLDKRPFTELRSAIDGEKPVPRIERRDNRESPWVYQLFDISGADKNYLTPAEYTALSELAGKPLPIYEGGKWDELIALQSKDEYGDWIDKRDFTAWRYTR